LGKERREIRLKSGCGFADASVSQR
jgi:hypothetical protein